jgi:hypothetical protein
MGIPGIADLHQVAVDCVTAMGDIFWDYDALHDTSGQYRDPSAVAVEEIEKTVRRVIHDALYSASAHNFRLEYEALLSELPENPTDKQIITSLVANADWTPEGARAVLMLAQTYGSFVLRNALALAKAMRIEDGEAGF